MQTRDGGEEGAVLVVMGTLEVKDGGIRGRRSLGLRSGYLNLCQLQSTSLISPREQ